MQQPTDLRRASLRQQLQAFQPSDATEAGHLRRMLALVEAPGDPFHRHHFEPGHFTASGFVLSPDGGSLLLILHGKLHRWLQPGGHVDPSDPDVEAAARREVAEEVGLHDLALEAGVAQPFDVDVHVIPPHKADPGHEHHDVRFLFRARTLEAQAGSDAKAARWVPLREVATLESDASVLRAVDRLLARR